MPTKYVHQGDLAIHYEHTGGTTLPDVPPPLDRGHTLLFLHGAGGTGRLWARQLAHFGASHSPVAIDLPGHGRSSGLLGPESTSEAAAIVAAVLERLGAPPAVVVGHGLGGKIALQIALDHAARVRAVVTIGTTAGAPGAEAEIEGLSEVVAGRRGQAFDTPFFAATPDVGVIRELWGEMVKTDPRVRLGDLRAHEAADLRSRLQDVRVPALVLHGEEDRYCSRSCAEEMAASIPGARLVLVSGAGHAAQLEQAEQVNRAIEEWLA